MSLYAISPVDGRYSASAEVLQSYFSEYALIKCRVYVEVEYFIALCTIPLPELQEVDTSLFASLRDVYLLFGEEDAKRVKAIEKTTNHDVKAVEYFLKEKFDVIGLSKYKEFIHFGLTSQDVNNTAMPYLLKGALESVIIPAYGNLIKTTEGLAEQWKDVAMLAHTHGQPASPTTMGKELLVFSERLKMQLSHLESIAHAAKFGGATGNFNAHLIAYPEVDWITFANNFANDTLGLKRTPVTTQIEPYDNLAAQMDATKRLNVILIDYCRDAWTYISMNYFKLSIKKGEVGSSAMPHKVNPIDFENAEGNLGLANALLIHMAEKLPVSRLQRDLTDSTVLRNTGVPFAHTLIALKAMQRGLGKLSINETKLHDDLDANWAVLAEAIQTVLRSKFYPEPYEKLKELTRTGGKLCKEDLHLFIDSLNIDSLTKEHLKELTPFNYIGMTSQFFE